MSIIKSGTTTTTAYSVDANTDGDLVFIVSESLTAMTISASGAVSFSSAGGFDIASANITNLTATTATVSASTYLASASGSVGVGTTGPNYQFHVTNNIAVGAAGFNQQLLLSNDSVQSQVLGVGYSTLKLNPLGAGVLCGSTVSVGGATPAASGAGITFPASQNASSNANTLDDYEEGSWTGKNGGGVTIDGGFTYTKVGNIVTVWGQVNDYYTQATNNNRVTNLPFTVSGTYGNAVMGSHNLAYGTISGYVSGTDIIFSAGNTTVALTSGAFRFVAVYTV